MNAEELAALARGLDTGTNCRNCCHWRRKPGEDYGPCIMSRRYRWPLDSCPDFAPKKKEGR